MRQALGQLGFGLLGVIIFLAVWFGVAALGHFAHFSALVLDVAFAIAGLTTYALYVRATEHREVTELESRLALPHLGWGFAIGIGLFALVIAIIALAGAYHVMRIGEPIALIRGIVAWVSGAIMEELLFRGFVFRVVRNVAGLWIALGVSASLFGFIHAANPGATVFSSVAIALEAGVLLGVAYAATNRLWLPIGIHAGWNYAEGSIFGTAVSGGRVHYAFFHGTLNGSQLLTGGAFGPEASIVAIPVCLAAAVVLAVRVKRQRLVEATV